MHAVSLSALRFLNLFISHKKQFFQHSKKHNNSQFSKHSKKPVYTILKTLKETNPINPINPTQSQNQSQVAQRNQRNQSHNTQRNQPSHSKTSLSKVYTATYPKTYTEFSTSAPAPSGKGRGSKFTNQFPQSSQIQTGPAFSAGPTR